MNIFKSTLSGLTSVILPVALLVGVTALGSIALTSGTVEAATATKKEPKAAKSYVLIYSGNGTYNSANITLEGSTKPFKCGTVNGQRLSTKKQGTLVSPTKFSCTPITEGTYKIVYGNNNKFISSPVSFTVEPGTCTLVHPNVPVTKRSVEGTKCSGDAIADPAVVQAASIRVLPAVKADKVKGFVEVSVLGTDLNRTQCSGTIGLVITGNDESRTSNVQLKYVPVDPKNPAVRNSYCAGKIPKTEQFKAGTYTVTANLNANPYLNAKTSTASVVVAASKKQAN